MEAFETFVALALETEGLVVSEAVKFKMGRQTSSGFQNHGYEVDLLGARRDRLVLASVKSYFGSQGVHADHVAGISKNTSYNKRYALLNDTAIRDHVVTAAAEKYGYNLDRVEIRLYVGKFAGRPGTHDLKVKEWCATQKVGGGTITVVGVDEVVEKVREVAGDSQYRDNAALVALKVLDAAGALLTPSANSGG